MGAEQSLEVQDHHGSSSRSSNSGEKSYEKDDPLSSRNKQPRESVQVMIPEAPRTDKERNEKVVPSSPRKMVKIHPRDVVQMIPETNAESEKEGDGESLGSGGKEKTFMKLVLLTHPGNQVLNLLALQQATSAPTEGYDEVTSAKEIVDQVIQKGGRFIAVSAGDDTSRFPEFPTVGFLMQQNEAIATALASLREVPPDCCRPLLNACLQRSSSSDEDAFQDADEEIAAGPDEGVQSQKKDNVPAKETQIPLVDDSSQPVVQLKPASTSTQQHQQHYQQDKQQSVASLNPGTPSAICPFDVVVASEDCARVRVKLQSVPGNQDYISMLMYAAKQAPQQGRYFDVDKEALDIVNEMARRGRRFILVGKFDTIIPVHGRILSNADVIGRIKADLHSLLLALEQMPVVTSLSEAYNTAFTDPGNEALISLADIVLAPKEHQKILLQSHPGNQAYTRTVLARAPKHSYQAPLDFEKEAHTILASMNIQGRRFVFVRNFDNLIPKKGRLMTQVDVIRRITADLKRLPMVPNPPPGELVGYHKNGRNPATVSKTPGLQSTARVTNGASAAPFSPQKKKLKRKLTKREIEEAIPADAGSIFQVFGRRVNLDSHTGDASLYSLLRSWVQDDPFRQIPYPGLCIHEHDRGFIPNKSDAADNCTFSNGKKNSLPQREKCDVLSQLKVSSEGTPSLDDLRKIMIQNARRVKRKKAADYRKRDLETVEMLKRRGIHLPS